MRYSCKPKLTTSFIVVIALLFAVNAPSFSLDIVKEVTNGVTLLQKTNDNPSFPLMTNMLSIDLNNPDLRLKAALGRDVVFTDDVYKGKENIASMVERNKAVAGINADFFPMEWGGDPLGVCIVNGELISEPNGNRAAFAITKDNKAVFDIPACEGSLAFADGTTVKLDGINKPRGTGQLVAYTNAFGTKIQSKFAVTYVRCTSENLPVTANKPVELTVVEILPGLLDLDIQSGNVVLAGGGESAKLLQEHIKADDTLSMRFDISSPSGYDWSSVEQAVGGGPWLVKDGVEFVDAKAEGFNGSLVTSAHPRSAIGITEDNKLLFVTVDGRQDISKGMNLNDLAGHLRRLGAKTAINLDGGGSTTLSIRGFVINSLSDVTERYVANGLLLFSNTSETAPVDSLSIAGIADTITAGDFAHLSAINLKDNSPLPETELSKIIWGSKSGMGFVDQMGRYAPTRTKTGNICMAYGPSVVNRTVSINAAPANKITAKIVPDKLDQFRATLELTSKDKLGNPTGDRIIALNVTGGTVDNGPHITDKNGKYSTGISWDVNSAVCKVDVKIDNATVSVRQVPIE